LSILFAIPCYGGIVSARTAIGMVDTGKELDRNNISHDFLMVSNQSLISKGRSEIANHFVNNTKYDYIMWIDSDIGFSAGDIAKLYNLKEQHTMATYRHKVQNVKYSYTLALDKGKPLWHNTNIAVKVLRNVGGFSLIHRSVFEKLNIVYKDLQYVPDTSSRKVSERELTNSIHYYETPIKNGQILPEDFAFQEKCTECGIDMWMVPSIKLIHNGNTDFVNDDIETTIRSI
jgi:hypothetical protein